MRRQELHLRPPGYEPGELLLLHADIDLAHQPDMGRLSAAVATAAWRAGRKPCLVRYSGSGTS